jgi:hypothetical protein
MFFSFLGFIMTTASKILHRLLLGAMVVFAFTSLVPPLRFAAALSVRALALLDLVALGTIEKNGWRSWLSISLKSVGIVLAIVGIITALIPLSIAAFGVDIFVQLKGMWTALRSRESSGKKAALFFAHLGFLIVDVLALAAIATGGWQLAVAAASISAFTMFVIAIGTFIVARVNNDLGSLFDGFCYLLLAGLGTSVARNSAKIDVDKPTAKFVAKNEGGEPMILVNNKGQVIGVVEPGQVAAPEIPASDASNILISRDVRMTPITKYDPYWDTYYTDYVSVSHDTLSPPFITTGAGQQVFGVDAVRTVTIQEAILPQDIPSLPMVPQAIPVDAALENIDSERGTPSDGACIDACCVGTACCLMLLSSRRPAPRRWR